MATFYHYTSKENYNEIINNMMIIPQEQRYIGNRKIKDDEYVLLFLFKAISFIFSSGKVIWLSKNKNVPGFSDSKGPKGRVLFEINISDHDAKNNIRNPYSFVGFISNVTTKFNTRITKKTINIQKVNSSTYDQEENRYIINLDCKF